MESKHSIAQIKLKSDESLSIKKVYKHKHRFKGLGDYEHMDAYMMTLVMDNNERYLMSLVMPNIDYMTNCSRLLILKQTGTDRNKISLGYGKLRAKDILVRYKRNSYMVNPDFIIPFKDYDKCIERWKELTT